jgi:phenylalanyl-tRNA synthetase beta chain
MKLTLTWLKKYLETDASLTALCDKLTALGLEVEGVKDPAQALAPFIIAEVLVAEKHPQADRLKVTTVDTGKEKLQIVCGAPNCRAGIKVVLARPGDVMPDSGEVLKKGVIRGVESQGMLCSAAELVLSTESEGIIELPADAPVGNNFASFMKLDDPVIEINLTPNRPDCAGIYGIARDLAAAGMGKLKPLVPPPVGGKEPSRIKVVLDFTAESKHHCPLFVSRLIRNVLNAQSPAWLQRQLTAVGLRPISTLVDITNYMTIDCDRPLHVFDAKKVKGNLVIRAARSGESFLALDGNTYELQDGMTVIADDSGVISLGGIMGGETTKCDESTTDVLIEAAYFDPVRTARTGRALNISSDARYRFERGIDPNFTIAGAELATQLIIDLCGTPETVVSELTISGAVPPAKSPITLNSTLCLKRTGVDVAATEQEKILTALGFAVKSSGASMQVTIPSWRPDIEGAADLVEEIVRIKGFDAITATSLSRTEAVPASAIDLQDQRANAARRALASQGLMEAVTWSFMPGAIAVLFGGGDPSLRLSNPISSDLDVMRPSILGNLMLVAKRNADRGFADVGLFEIGPVYQNATPDGQATVAAALRAGLTPRHWAEPTRAVDAYDAKADALAALAVAGAPVNSLQITTDAPAYYHPGRSGTLRLGSTILAAFGELHPSIMVAADVSTPMVACEIFFTAIPQSRSSGTAKPLLKLEPLQAISRDFAFVVESDVTAAKLVKAVRDADKVLIRDVNVFDVYIGEHVASGKKSVALSVTLQPTEKTLTDAEIEAIATRITAAVTKATGAILRG